MARFGLSRRRRGRGWQRSVDRARFPSRHPPTARSSRSCALGFGAAQAWVDRQRSGAEQSIDERISRIWVVADELSRLAQLEAITLAAPADDT